MRAQENNQLFHRNLLFQHANVARECHATAGDAEDCDNALTTMNVEVMPGADMTGEVGDPAERPLFSAEMSTKRKARQRKCETALEETNHRQKAEESVAAWPHERGAQKA